MNEVPIAGAELKYNRLGMLTLTAPVLLSVPPELILIVLPLTVVADTVPDMLIPPVPLILKLFRGKLPPSPVVALIVPTISTLPVPLILKLFRGKLPPRPVVAFTLPTMSMLPVPVILREFNVKLPPRLGLVSDTTLVTPLELAVTVCVTGSYVNVIPTLIPPDEYVVPVKLAVLRVVIAVLDIALAKELASTTEVPMLLIT